ncbi:MAG: hypothetical protein LBQ88_12285 [Treponema sp.]|nr:hypothetical protein [Treponema sp.]
MKRTGMLFIMLSAVIWCAGAQTYDAWYAFQLKYSDTSIYAMLVFAPDGNITRAADQIALSIQSDLNVIGERNISSQQRQWAQAQIGKLEQLKQYTNDRGRQYLADSLNNEINRQPWARIYQDSQAFGAQPATPPPVRPSPPVTPAPQRTQAQPVPPARPAAPPPRASAPSIPARPVPPQQPSRPRPPQQPETPEPSARPAPPVRR